MHELIQMRKDDDKWEHMRNLSLHAVNIFNLDCWVKFASFFIILEALNSTNSKL